MAGFLLTPEPSRSVLDLERVVLGVDVLWVGAAAHAGVERVDRRDFFGRQREVEDVEVLCDAVRLDRLRDRGDAVLDVGKRELRRPTREGCQIPVQRGIPVFTPFTVQLSTTASLISCGAGD
jgi:hypothetical protein